jgi:tRNA(adenine34) deaminase
MERAAAEHFVRVAMVEARLAVATGNRPFGAVIVSADGTVVARDHNRVVEHVDPTAHAELNAIRAACRRTDQLALLGHALITNAEPCPMCFTCMVKVGISELWYGASAEPGSLPAVPLRDLATDGRIEIHGGVLAGAAQRQLERLRPNADA